MITENKRHSFIISMTSEEELIKSGVIANENTIILGFKRFALNAQYKILIELSELMKGLFLFISHDFIM